MYFLGICLLVLTLAIGNFLFEFRKVLSTQGEYLPDGDIDALNARSSIDDYYGPAPRSGSTKVLLVLLDGFRFDFLSRNADMAAFLRSPKIAPHSKTYKMRVQLPTMSVPNWVTSLTGSPPEMSGVLGNLLVPETKYDSIFNEAQIYDVNRGMTASPWMSDIVKSTLPFLNGDGTLSPSTLPKVNGVPISVDRPTADPGDELRAQVALEALSLQSTPLEYKLFLAHFSDVDMQGHTYGVSKTFNHGNTYDYAVTNKTRILDRLTDAVDDDTVVMIFADHGHVDRGGHGGIQDELLKVPLIVYRKNSGFASSSYSGPAFSEEIENTDLAPTVSALLGLPVPRQAQGKYITDTFIWGPMGSDPNSRALAYRDLFIQKQRLVAAFLKSVPSWSSLDNDLVYGNHSAKSEEFHRNGVERLLSTMKSARARAISLWVLRNALLTLALNTVVLGVIAYVLEVYTFVDVSLMFRCLCCSRFSDDPDRAKNIKAFAWSLWGVTLFYFMTIGFFILLYIWYGHPIDEWESTLIHTPAAVPRYLAYLFVPSIVFAFLLHRSYHISSISFRKIIPGSSFGAKLRVVGMNFLNLFSDSSAHVRHPDFVYLARYYVGATTVCAVLTIFVAQSTFTVLVPLIFRIPFVTEAYWGLRFRLLTVQMMSMPLIIGSMIEVYLSGRNLTDYRVSETDPVYLLKIRKDSRHHAARSTTDIERDEIVRILQPQLTDQFDGVHTTQDLLTKVISPQAIREASRHAGHARGAAQISTATDLEMDHLHSSSPSSSSSSSPPNGDDDSSVTSV